MVDSTLLTASQQDTPSGSSLLQHSPSMFSHPSSTVPKALNRRQFLTKAAIGIGGLSALSSANAVAALLSPETLERETGSENTHCASPTIETRLFASSNVAEDSLRNQLALKRLGCSGFKIINPEVTQRQYLRFAGTDAQRASDLQNIATGAIKAPKLLLGVRGGYGAMRLLPMIDWASLGRVMKQQGTIMAGFSDITAIQCALLAKGGVGSLAAPMYYSEFGKTQPDKVSCQSFVEAITNPNLSISIPRSEALISQDHNNDGDVLMSEITGTLWGGNLTMVTMLAGSDYLPKIDGGIVFLEDTGEPPYSIERMLYSLYLAGVFKHQQAIVLGAFSSVAKDSYDSRYDLSRVTQQLKQATGLPILSGVPFGHVAGKHSLPLGAKCTLTANDTGYQLSFSGYPTIASDTIHPEALWS
ncbi:MAG: LD-carboxypeptidase [Psychrobacter sp.]|nr:LD-carboxypeptidase [Psychrobacter sp.]